jgi:hypothetical protein
MTRRRAAESDGRLQRTPRYADAPALCRWDCATGIDQEDVTGLFVSSWPIDAPGLPCVLQTTADQASGQSLGGFPSRGPPAPPSRRRLLYRQSLAAGPLARRIRPSRIRARDPNLARHIPALEHGEVDHPDRDVDRPARSRSSAQCREDASIARIHGDRHRHSAREALRCVAPDESHRKKGTLLQEPWTTVPFFRTWLRGVGQAWPAPHPPPPCRQVRSGQFLSGAGLSRGLPCEYKVPAVRSSCGEHLPAGAGSGLTRRERRHRAPVGGQRSASDQAY